MTETDMDCSEEYKPGPNAVDISPNQDKGVLKEILKEGSGSEMPGSGDKVFVHYVGKLLDGTVFDSSRAREELFEFQLGKGAVIKGWDIGVATMKKDELAVLTCTSDYAYGESGSPPKIPPGATLVFEVELFKWEMEDLSPEKDLGIQRRILQAGEGFTSPKDDAIVEVHLIGRYDGTVFEERDAKFPMGEGSEHKIVKGLEEALQKFKKGEKSLLKLTSTYAFGPSGNAEFNIPPNAAIEYEVTLKSFELAKESWELSNEERLEQSVISKSKGTSFFKVDKFELALRHYKRASSMLEMEDCEEEQEGRRRVLLLAAQLNVAMCHLKLEDYNYAIECCNQVLELDPKNEKGLFRRGQAYMGLKDFEVAIQAFEAVLEVDKENKAAKNQVIKCQTAIKQFQEKEKRMYKNMFAKFVEQDEKKNAKNVESSEFKIVENGDQQSEEKQKIDELESETAEVVN